MMEVEVFQLYYERERERERERWVNATITQEQKVCKSSTKSIRQHQQEQEYARALVITRKNKVKKMVGVLRWVSEGERGSGNSNSNNSNNNKSNGGGSIDRRIDSVSIGRSIGEHTLFFYSFYAVVVVVVGDGCVCQRKKPVP
jgi:hypothetical protein